MTGLEIRYLKEVEKSSYWQNILALKNKGLFFYSSEWINFLKEYLQAEDFSLGVFTREGQLLAFLNLLVKDGPLGRVANSSPFYGSNGGIIIDLSLPQNIQMQIKKKLLSYIPLFEKENNVVLTCIITNPLYQDDDFYRKSLEWDYEDYRIGQLTFLPESEEDLFPLFHYKTRNVIRKAQKFGFEVYKAERMEELEVFYRIHRENMEAIGGKAKDFEFFENVLFNSNCKCDLLIATYKDEIAAGLLLFHFGDVVEYYNPVIKHEYRTYQPLSLLIYEAMREAVKQGKKIWNWGGTWKGQEGVYRFKSRWGTKDMNYYYFIRFSSPEKKEMFLGCEAQFLIDNYKYFYTVPFTQLKREKDG